VLNSIAMGYQAKATGDDSIAIGEISRAFGTYRPLAVGFQAYALQSYSTAIGSYAQADAPNATALGSSATANGDYSIAIGDAIADAYFSVAIGKSADTNGIRGKYAFACNDFSNSGDAQTGTYVLRSDTTNATAEALTTNNGTASTDNQVILPNNSVYGFTGTVIAREDSSSTNDFAVWEVKGGAVRAANASTTTLGSYNINVISKSTGAANWDIALSADTTNGAVAITVTGEASHNIRWVATINTTEVTY